MTQYIQFDTRAGHLLVEVEGQAVDETEEDEVIKAGLGDRIRTSVAAAGSSLEEALVQVIRANARVFVEAAMGLEQRPAEMELTFGVKATGEIGNLAISKAGGEANYTVRLLWKGE
ncbi:CU044_2847 family protein [Streptomyces sp. NPDC057620]|uniref:CU044_2847 family protein n=1 Tax=Streptomyces sp. NPDC057620 TaxID=3346185 RepID=UPI00367E0FD9